MSSKSIEKIDCEETGELVHTNSSPEEFQQMTCKEDAVSPININYGNTCKVTLPELSWENWNKKPLKMELINTGYTVLLAGIWRRYKPMISGGPLTSRYRFLQLHFHWGNKDEEGSFHTFDNEALPLEMHAVFLKECYKTQEEALMHSDGMMVLVYVYKVHNSGSQSIEVISQLCPLVQQPGKSVFCPTMEIGSLLYPFLHDYFVYWGSIKVKEKDHPMLWLLCRQPFTITSVQLRRFRGLRNFDVENSRDCCRVELPNNKENNLFLVNPTSSVQSTLYKVDPDMKWEDIKTKFAASKDEDLLHNKKKVEKSRLRGFYLGDDDHDIDLSNQFNLNLVAKALRAVKSFMGKSINNDVGKPCSKSFNDIYDTLKLIDNSRVSSDGDKPIARVTIAEDASLERAKSTVLCSSPSNEAQSAQTASDSCEHQVEQSDCRQEGGSESNCSGSKIELAVDHEEEVSDEIRIEHSKSGASSEPESLERDFVFTRDSVHYLRQKYRRKRQTADVNNRSPTPKNTKKAMQQSEKLKSKIDHNLQVTQNQSVNKSSIPLKIKPYKSILKSSTTPPKINEENSSCKTTSLVQRSSTAPGILAGKPLPPSNKYCRPTTAQENKTIAVERPVTSNEHCRSRSIQSTNRDKKPVWKY